MTSGAWDTTYNGALDAFVAKLNDTGSSLLYATYLGGKDEISSSASASTVPGTPM